MVGPIKYILSRISTDVVADIALSRSIELPEKLRNKIEYPPDLKMGHYSSPVAMELASIFREKPFLIATQIKEGLLKNDELKQIISNIEIAGPGFLNFYVSEIYHSLILEGSVINLSDLNIKVENPRKIIFEFVSANPTGPLNTVSARAAAIGDSICNVLERVGNKVFREYYVNDYGNQVYLLGISFAYRYLQLKGYDVILPEECYQGEYIIDVLNKIIKDHGDTRKSISVELDSSEKIEKSCQELGVYFAPLAIEYLVDTQKSDLHKFRVDFNNFFSEKSLHESGEVMITKDILEKKNKVYLKDEALHFSSTDYGDNKDRVIVRSDGRPTYLLADIAYHHTKITRGFDTIYNIWGPDHHGYIARLSGAMQALGFGLENSDQEFKVLIVQQVNMIEDGKSVVMSKRLGKFHTMADLLDKIPVDVIRYFFLMRSQSAHLDFDLDLALTHSSKNPVYYIQYAYARIRSIFREVELDFATPVSVDKIDNSIYSCESRSVLLVQLWRYNEVINEIAKNLEIHHLPEYLHNVATLFTAFYHDKENNIIQTLKEDQQKGRVLLRIIQLCAAVISDGLSLLGIESPEKM